MLILVISDNHGVMNRMMDVVRRVKPDLLVHLGDSQMHLDTLKELAGCPVEAVAGNCDYSSGLPREKEIQLGSIRAFLTHGDRYGVRSGTGYLRSVAEKRGCQLALYGHTHVPLLEYHPEMVVLNPGSISAPRQGDGIGTYGLIEIDSVGQLHYTLCKYVKSSR